MKAILRSLLLAALLILGAAASTFAQNVSTGVIAGYQPKEGTLTIRSDQTQGLVTFFGVDKANISTADGKVVMISSLPLGSKVTVQFAKRDDKWYVEKVLLPADAPAGAIPKGLPIGNFPSRLSPDYRALHDDDITTNGDPHPGRVLPVLRR